VEGWAGCDGREIARELYRLNLLVDDDPKDQTRFDRSREHRSGATMTTPPIGPPRPRTLAVAPAPVGSAATLAYRYLRETRGLRGPFSCTPRVPARLRDHPPALIAAYGLPVEAEPGVLELPIEAVLGVQLISLTDDCRKLGQAEDHRPVSGVRSCWRRWAIASASRSPRASRMR